MNKDGIYIKRPSIETMRRLWPFTLDTPEAPPRRLKKKMVTADRARQLGRQICEGGSA